MTIKTEIKSPTKEFKIFLSNLNFAYEQFCFLEKIRKKPLNAFFKKNRRLWENFRVSLLRSYLLELSKIFEKQKSNFPAVLSIYYLLDFEFRNHEKTLAKLRELRNKFLVHTDLRESERIEQFIEEIGLSSEEIDGLFNTTYKIVAKIVENQGLHGDYILAFYKEIKEKVNKSI